jgi:hypothetical protein
MNADGYGIQIGGDISRDSSGYFPLGTWICVRTHRGVEAAEFGCAERVVIACGVMLRRISEP